MTPNTTTEPKPKRPHGNTRNQNRRKHGARSKFNLTAAVAGNWADQYRQSYINKVRRRLESAALAIHGTISILIEAWITSALRAERCIKVHEAWGRQAERTELERMQVAEKVLSFAAIRDRYLEKILGAGPGASAGKPRSIADLLADTSDADDAGQEPAESTPATADDPEPVDPVPDATGEPSGVNSSNHQTNGSEAAA
jgi:hypothetical protein